MDRNGRTNGYRVIDVEITELRRRFSGPRTDKWRNFWSSFVLGVLMSFFIAVSAWLGTLSGEAMREDRQNVIHLEDDSRTPAETFTQHKLPSDLGAPGSENTGDHLSPRAQGPAEANENVFGKQSRPGMFSIQTCPGPNVIVITPHVQDT